MPQNHAKPVFDFFFSGFPIRDRRIYKGFSSKKIPTLKRKIGYGYETIDNSRRFFTSFSRGAGNPLRAKDFPATENPFDSGRKPSSRLPRRFFTSFSRGAGNRTRPTCTPCTRTADILRPATLFGSRSRSSKSTFQNGRSNRIPAFFATSSLVPRNRANEKEAVVTTSTWLLMPGILVDRHDIRMRLPGRRRCSYPRAGISRFQRQFRIEPTLTGHLEIRRGFSGTNVTTDSRNTIIPSMPTCNLASGVIRTFLFFHLCLLFSNNEHSRYPGKPKRRNPFPHIFNHYTPFQRFRQ